MFLAPRITLTEQYYLMTRLPTDQMQHWVIGSLGGLTSEYDIGH